jgi:hypothetical protein
LNIIFAVLARIRPRQWTGFNGQANPNGFGQNSPWALNEPKGDDGQFVEKF